MPHRAATRFTAPPPTRHREIRRTPGCRCPPPYPRSPGAPPRSAPSLKLRSLFTSSSTSPRICVMRARSDGPCQREARPSACARALARGALGAACDLRDGKASTPPCLLSQEKFVLGDPSANDDFLKVACDECQRTFGERIGRDARRVVAGLVHPRGATFDIRRAQPTCASCAHFATSRNVFCEMRSRTSGPDRVPVLYCYGLHEWTQQYQHPYASPLSSAQSNAQYAAASAAVLNHQQLHAFRDVLRTRLRPSRRTARRASAPSCGSSSPRACTC